MLLNFARENVYRIAESNLHGTQIEKLKTLIELAAATNNFNNIRSELNKFQAVLDNFMLEKSEIMSWQKEILARVAQLELALKDTSTERETDTGQF